MTTAHGFQPVPGIPCLVTTEGYLQVWDEDTGEFVDKFNTKDWGYPKIPGPGTYHFHLGSFHNLDPI